MFRMLSGLTAHVIGGLWRPLKSDGKVSAYRVVLAATLAAVGLGLWAGWAQWVALGDGLSGGFLVGVSTFLARWAAAAWLVIVLLWPLVGDKDDLAGGGLIVSLFVCLIATGAQAMVVHGAFDPPPPRTHYSVKLSCQHCDAKCWATVKIGESWTDWGDVECCKCGITVQPGRVPEYAETREAWESRIADGGGGGAED